MNENEYQKELISLSDKKYQAFSQKLAGSDLRLLGIRIPLLVSLIKKESKDEELLTSKLDPSLSLEMTLSYLGISLLRMDSFQEQMKFLTDNLYLAKSWICTDCLGKFFKKSTLKDYQPFFNLLLRKKGTWSKRFAFVYASTYLKDRRVLSLLKKIKPTTDYYVLMSQAWFIANLGVYYPSNIYEFLSQSSISSYLKKKAIQKLLESYRISQGDKDRYRLLRNQI